MITINHIQNKILKTLAYLDFKDIEAAIECLSSLIEEIEEEELQSL